MVIPFFVLWKICWDRSDHVSMNTNIKSLWKILDAFFSVFAAVAAVVTGNVRRSTAWNRKHRSHTLKVKVKCTLVQVLRFCTGRTAHRGSRDIVLPFLNHGTRRGWRVSVTPRPLFTPRKDPLPIVQEATRWWTLDKTELLPNIYTHSSLFAAVRFQDRRENLRIINRLPPKQCFNKLNIIHVQRNEQYKATYR
jgi:hypothetical protein